MNAEDYDYVNRMAILYEPLQLIDIAQLVEQCTDKWFNQTLCRVNESLVRLGILQGEYHWHKHDKEDEFFFTLDGVLIIDQDHLFITKRFNGVHPSSFTGRIVPERDTH